MSHDHNQDQNQTNDDLDTILLAEFNSAGQLQPSSGFTTSVMDSIHQQATAPPPIPFPWKRILPGGIAILFALIALVRWAFHASGSMAVEDNLFSFSRLFFNSSDALLCWIALSFTLTLITIATSFRLADGRRR